MTTRTQESWPCGNNNQKNNNDNKSNNKQQRQHTITTTTPTHLNSEHRLGFVQDKNK